MAAQISVNIGSLILPLVGVKGIDVLVDGTVAALSLRGVITRTSNAVAVNVNEGGHATVTGKYSRMWGNFKLKLG